jgi:hypothetical protein
MVDKLWYDWQHAHPNNFWSFGGGAVATDDESFPTGAPPYVNVRTLLTSVCSANKNLRSSRHRSRQMGSWSSTRFMS